MSVKLEIQEVVGYSDTHEAWFSVSRMDQAAEVKLSETLHDADSWRECADAIAKAVDMVLPKGDA